MLAFRSACQAGKIDFIFSDQIIYAESFLFVLLCRNYDEKIQILFYFFYISDLKLAAISAHCLPKDLSAANTHILGSTHTVWKYQIAFILKKVISTGTSTINTHTTLLSLKVSVVLDLLYMYMSLDAFCYCLEIDLTHTHTCRTI